MEVIYRREIDFWDVPEEYTGEMLHNAIGYRKMSYGLISLGVGYILDRIAIVAFDGIIRTLAVIIVKMDIIDTFELEDFEQFEQALLEQVVDNILAEPEISIGDAVIKALEELERIFRAKKQKSADLLTFFRG